MVDLFFLRASFIAILASTAFFFQPFQLLPGQAAGVAAVTASFFVYLEWRLRRLPAVKLIGGAAGIIAGLVAAALIAVVLSQLQESGTLSFLKVATGIAAAYAGMLLGAAKAESMNLPISATSSVDSHAGMNILDTSVIIDGRIADIAETRFLDGSLAIPDFVLRELQLVADSSDSLKRNRGRRGLDILQRLQKLPQLKVQILEEDFLHIREVDMKLVELGKLHGCRIVTNDFNLNKVAQLHGVQVLNINELANALRPIVLPGETMRVFILKEGKEYNQGVAYLDDGTMVVVDNARRMISKTVDVIVTSVLQTTAGKMIFGKFDERSQTQDRPAAKEAVQS